MRGVLRLISLDAAGGKPAEPGSDELQPFLAKEPALDGSSGTGMYRGLSKDPTPLEPRVADDPMPFCEAGLNPEPKPYPNGLFA